MIISHDFFGGIVNSKKLSSLIICHSIFEKLEVGTVRNVMFMLQTQNKSISLPPLINKILKPKTSKYDKEKNITSVVLCLSGLFLK